MVEHADQQLLRQDRNRWGCMMRAMSERIIDLYVVPVDAALSDGDESARAARERRPCQQKWMDCVIFRTLPWRRWGEIFERSADAAI